jgi:hypothetical protein
MNQLVVYLAKFGSLSSFCPTFVKDFESYNAQIVKLFFFLLALMSCTCAFSQAISDNRLLAVYDVKTLETLSIESPDFLARQIFLLDQAWYIVSKETDKPLQAGEIVFDAATFNYLLAFREGVVYRQWSAPTYFKIAGSDNKVFVCRSGQELAKLWNQHRGTQVSLSEPQFEKN